MGYDITFHSISKNELKQFSFDIIIDPSCAEARSKSIPASEEKQKAMYEHLYKDNLVPWGELVRQGKGETMGDISPSFSMAAAAISGYLHPYHYSRNFSLSLISDKFPEVRGYFTSLTNVDGSPLVGLSDSDNGLISSNYCSSGVSDKPSSILEFIKNNEESLITEYGSDEISAIKCCLDYCISLNSSSKCDTFYFKQLSTFL
ncbi:hypothetical protein MSP8887_03596 [Marinomonas spartinae]|uniref:hypothetical protein n=1 Tax=Marinomonas spartinae TaxID=1792290 RepID=UPI000808B7D3|nr:hypothetical protein [Marinomonas spartinae]SBS38996.1 hypothetical protein MSP8887_03596 [Marinomonas spartinae]